MAESSAFSIRKRIRSFYFAFRGIWFFFHSQHNAWIHAAAASVVVALGCMFRLSATEWCLIVLAIGWVWMAEMFNTALELLTDRISPEFHPLAEKTKDVAAGAVLVSAIGAAIMGLIVFLPKIFRI
jgi:diacylglycerol kinase (ATP)